MWDFQDARWQQTYQLKSIVLGNVRMLRTKYTMDIYLVSLLPPSVQKSPIIFVLFRTEAISARVIESEALMIMFLQNQTKILSNGGFLKATLLYYTFCFILI